MQVRVVIWYLQNTSSDNMRFYEVFARELKINWIKPNLDDELEEYFGNNHTKEFLKKYDITFSSKGELLNFLLLRQPRPY